MLKSYLPVVKTPIFPQRHSNKICSEKFVNQLHEWLENYPHVIDSPKVSDKVFVKINGNIVKKQKHLLQISVRELQNDMEKQTFSIIECY